MKSPLNGRFGWLARIWAVARKHALLHPAPALAVAFMGGIVFWGGFNWSLDLANTEEFCISCHVMESNIYDDFRQTIHYSNRTGVRATCPDCHVPEGWVHKVVRKVGATNELFHWAIGSISTREKFEAKLPELAARVWNSMEKTDSRECRNCHHIDFMSEETQEKTAGIMHSLAEGWEMTCISCHKGVAHKLPRQYDQYALMDELHIRMETEDIDCKQCHAGLAQPDPDDGWDDDGGNDLE